MFNPFKSYSTRKKFRLYEKDIREGIYNFESSDGRVIRVDPLMTYVRLKELGFDVMSENISGAFKGDLVKTRTFFNAVCDAFEVESFNPIRGGGLTLLDAFRLYLGFYRFLEALKKNITFLRDFAPSMEARIMFLTTRQTTSQNTVENSPTSEEEKALEEKPDANEKDDGDSRLSDSISISQTPPPSSGSGSTTEQAAPLADSGSTSIKPSTEETTNT